MLDIIQHGRSTPFSSAQITRVASFLCHVRSGAGLHYRARKQILDVIYIQNKKYAILYIISEMDNE